MLEKSRSSQYTSLVFDTVIFVSHNIQYTTSTAVFISSSIRRPSSCPPSKASLICSLLLLAFRPLLKCRPCIGFGMLLLSQGKKGNYQSPKFSKLISIPGLSWPPHSLNPFFAMAASYLPCVSSSTDRGCLSFCPIYGGWPRLSC